MNQPYVKQFDENGVCTNPITKSIIHRDMNRMQRRSFNKKRRASFIQPITYRWILVKRGSRSYIEAQPLEKPKFIKHFINH